MKCAGHRAAVLIVDLWRSWPTPWPWSVTRHCLTPHAALPNVSSSLRLSGDFRWQRPDQPAPAELILGPRGRRPELFSRAFSGERWWEPVPAGLALYPRAELAAVPPGPSRLIAVHRGWKHWRPPPPAVH